MIHLDKFSKIFSVGDRHVKSIFVDPIVIEEKADGSQIGFGRVSGKLLIRSKGQLIDLDNPDKLFFNAVNYIKSIEHFIPDNSAFYGEYLSKPKHNTLAYNRVPKNHIMLFGACVDDQWIKFQGDLSYYADMFNIDCVPRLYEGVFSDPKDLLQYLEQESYLGGSLIEGVVIKNYSKELWLNTEVYYPIMCAKFVSEKFKEVHHKLWRSENTGKGKLETLTEKYRSEARWNKAIMNIKEYGLLDESPRDIGNIIQYVQKDLLEEESENFKEELFKIFKKDWLQRATQGLPEWYKEKLLKDCEVKESYENLQS